MAIVVNCLQVRKALAGNRTGGGELIYGCTFNMF